MGDTIRAAGGVLWRPAGDGIEVCVVHRPALDDWVLPKGKLDGAEHSLVAAVREVLEETGVRGRPQLRLPEISYELPDGTPKTVDFWLMRAGDDPAVDVADATEVDAVTWLSPARAGSRLSYPDDAALVEHAAGLPPVTAITPLVRHAHAGERKKWSGDDALRPIDADGRTEADGLGVLLSLFDPARLFAATPLRCKQTLQPLADRLGLPIVIDSAFAEPADLDELPAKVKVAASRLGELRDGGTAGICSQGKVIPPLLAALLGAEDSARYKTPKGTGWLLAWSGDTLTAVSRL
jgi:8-oxo-(d)GTP phosphatase